MNTEVKNIQEKKKEEPIPIYDKDDEWITPEYMIEIVPDIIPTGVKRIIASYYLNDDLHVKWLSKIYQKITDKNTCYLNHDDFESLPSIVEQISASNWKKYRESLFELGTNDYLYLYIEYIPGGVDNWGNFQKILQGFMPAIKGLYFQQPYCQINSRKEFLTFLTEMKLQLFIFYDQNSKGLIPSINEFKEVMVTNSLYVINYYIDAYPNYSYCGCFAILLIMIKKRDRFIVKKYRKIHAVYCEPSEYTTDNHTKPVLYRLLKNTNFNKHEQ